MYWAARVHVRALRRMVVRENHNGIEDLEILQTRILLGKGAEARDIDHEGDLPGYLVEIHQVAIDIVHRLSCEHAHMQRGCGNSARNLL